jgi:hypothetical protein
MQQYLYCIISLAEVWVYIGSTSWWNPFTQIGSLPSTVCVCVTRIASATRWERRSDTLRVFRYTYTHGDVSTVLYSVNVASASVFVFWKSIILWWHSICMQPQRTAELCPAPKRISVIFYFSFFFSLSLSLSILFLRLLTPLASSFALNQKLSTSSCVFLYLSSVTISVSKKDKGL